MMPSRLLLSLLIGLPLLTTVGCGYRIPESMLFEPRPEISGLEELTERVTQRIGPIHSVKLMGSLTVSRDGKGMTFHSGMATRGKDVSVHARKLGELAFDFRYDGDNYAFIDHWHGRFKKGRSTDVTKDKPELASLPPNLTGLNLYVPLIEPGPGETASYDERGDYHWIVYRRTDDSGRTWVAREIRVHPDALLVDRVRAYSPDGDLMASVIYNRWHWVELERADENMLPKQVPFPCSIELHAERDGKEFGIQISVSKDEVELNKELPSRLFKARIPRTYDEMKDDEDDEDVEEAEQEAVQ